MKNHVLTKYTKDKKVKSDHNIIITSFNIGVNPDSQEARLEIYNLKNHACQQNFKEATTNTKELSQIFDSDKDINVLTKKFLKRLNGFICQNFKKIRITEDIDKNLEKLYNMRSELRNKTDEDSKEKLKDVEKQLEDEYSNDFYEKIKKELQGVSCEEGGWNPSNLWKLKKKLSPRYCDPPTAMINSKGILLTDNKDIKDEAMKHYKKVLENKEMEDEEFQNIKLEREELCKMRLNKASENKTVD